MLLVFVTVCRVAAGEDKNGVSAKTISVPSGPGSLEGFGDAFQPALNTGTAKYSVAFQLPSGVAGFSPSLSLQYDAGNGFGVAGLGWSISLGDIRRQSDKGLPLYGRQVGGVERPDRFIGMDGEELVPLANGLLMAKIQGNFTRYQHVSSGDQDYWYARTRDGTELIFGRSPLGKVASKSGNVYRWCLERQIDTHGNAIDYHYERPDADDRQIYLREIRYGPSAGPWTSYYSIQLFYEERHDPFTDYRSGFRVRTTKRLKRVDIRYVDELVRRYVLTYEAHPHWSLLTTVTQFGDREDCSSTGGGGDDSDCALPRTRFGYNTRDATSCQEPVSAAGAILLSSGEPSNVMDGAETELIDLNADGLPDLLTTESLHIAWLNRGVQREPGQAGRVFWEGPIQVQALDAGVWDLHLSSPNVHLADMTGDGVSDFVVTDALNVQYYPNTGDDRWGEATRMINTDAPPPAPFGPDGRNVRTLDADFDKRIDVLRSEGSGYSVWLNLGGGRYSQELRSNGCRIDGALVELGDSGVDIADMNGDRLADVVRINPRGAVFCPGMGYGEFDAAVAIDFDLSDPLLTEEQISQSQLIDVDGDGLTDLVIPRFEGATLRYWPNLGNAVFAPSCTIVDLPDTPNAAIRWADINGNGTTDLIYADSYLPESRIQAVDVAELMTGTPFANSLRSIENGYGRTIMIHYRSSADFAIDALAAANPWAVSSPFPSPVVARVETTSSMNLDGHDGADPLAPNVEPGVDVYITDFVYRDAFYDPLEKQFRGFAFVKQIQHGDERFGGDSAPTLVTRHRFHTGAPDQIDNDGNGRMDEFDPWNGREEEPLKGVELWSETTSLPDDPLRDGEFASDTNTFERGTSEWTVREVANAQGGPLTALLNEAYRTTDSYGRTVRQAVPTKARRTIIERLPSAAEHKVLETRSDIDALGSTLFAWNLGDTANPDDDSYTANEYAHNEAIWLMGLPTRTIVRQGGPDGAWVSEARNYYDGPPFQGLSLGKVGTRGLLHRTEGLISGGPVPEITERSYLRGDPRDPDGKVDTVRQKFDEYGNVIVALNANARLNEGGEPDGHGHERRMAYDPVLHKFPVRETIVLGNAKGNLEVTAMYDFRFGTPLAITDFNGHVSQFTYDTFGRLEKEILPGDDPQAPTRRYTFTLGNPISSITTTAHTKEGDSPDVVTTKYFDGTGRTLGTYEHGGPVMSGLAMHNARGIPFRAFQTFWGTPPADPNTWVLPGPDVAFTTMRYDAAGRVVETISLPDNDGLTARATTAYLPLKVVQYDGEDNKVGGPHYNTPKTLISDGLGRLIEVREIETLSQADSGTFVTVYRYALPDLLAEIEDANHNIKYMRYDGLGRRIFMNDCNRGHVTDRFDAVGNEIATVDAKGQRIEYTYDGANRMLSEDYLDDDSPLSFHRSPDVRFHYDAPSDEYYMLHNVRGKLSWVEDLTGAEFHGYDSRGNLETTVKRIEQIDGGFEDYATTTYADSLGRVYQIIYPDGGVVRQEYDSRGFLSRIPHFLESMQYAASGQRASWTFGNGVVTTYDYDSRQRLTRLHTLSPVETLQDLSYVYDQADNITAIDDARPLPEGDPRTQTASYLMDDLYRLQRADGIGWSQQFDYDRLGNMTRKLSTDPAHLEEHIGTMFSGGSAGTFNRIGRSPGDPPGPHALTSADNGATRHVFDYDDNGNMVDDDGDGYVWDFKDRLGKVVKDGHDIRYLYDYTDRRVIKRVDGVPTAYISTLSELRDSEAINYVFAGEARIAHVKGRMPEPPEVTQRLSFLEGWNLFSFQVAPPSSSPIDVLADLNTRYAALFGHDGTDYLRFARGAGDNTLTALHPNRGYWIYMTERVDLLVKGPIATSPMNLVPHQWWLVGIPGLSLHLFSQLDPGSSAIGAAWTFPRGATQWNLILGINAPTLLWRLANGQVPGDAYWIRSSTTRAPSDIPPTGGAIRLYHQDHLGSTNFTTDNAGTLVGTCVYYPFGAQRETNGAGDRRLDPPYSFGDKEADKESRNQYFLARYYRNAVGRFCSADPVASMSIAPGGGFATGSPYAFSSNNPITRRDPDGADDDTFLSYASDFGIGLLKAGGDILRSAVETLPPVMAYRAVERVVDLANRPEGMIAAGEADAAAQRAALVEAVSTIPERVERYVNTVDPHQAVQDVGRVTGHVAASLLGARRGAAVNAARAAPSSRVIHMSGLSEVPSAAPGTSTIVLGHYNTPGVFNRRDVLMGIARDKGGRTLADLTPGRKPTISEVVPELQQADRILFFTSKGMTGLTAQEMGAIQESADLMTKTTVVYGLP